MTKNTKTKETVTKVTKKKKSIWELATTSEKIRIGLCVLVIIAVPIILHMRGAF